MPPRSKEQQELVDLVEALRVMLQLDELYDRPESRKKGWEKRRKRELEDA